MSILDDENTIMDDIPRQTYHVDERLSNLEIQISELKRAVLERDTKFQEYQININNQLQVARSDIAYLMQQIDLIKHIITDGNNNS